MDKLSEQITGELSRFGPQAGLAELLARWPEAVGGAIARNAWPSRIARDGTVHVSTSDSVWAFELGHSAAEIAARLGVPRLRFAPGPIPEQARDATPSEQLVPTMEQEREAAAVASAIEDEHVRESVQKAVLFSLARRAADRSL